MSIVRVGMAEDGKFSAGYDAIFKKGKAGAAKKPAAAKPAKAVAKKPAGKKPAAKKK
ncbi:MAG: hypothetical protein K2X87_23200 [Gemmataceae bacterium]|nr:hypothetical protein [Gemmataceae bacterium]